MKRILFGLGLVLVAQAVGYLPLHGLFERKWLYVSIGLGVIGLALLLIRRRLNKYDPTVAPDGDLYPGRHSEVTGSQVLNLIKKMDRDD